MDVKLFFKSIRPSCVTYLSSFWTPPFRPFAKFDVQRDRLRETEIQGTTFSFLVLYLDPHEAVENLLYLP